MIKSRKRSVVVVDVVLVVVVTGLAVGVRR
jgi:hypothetical protein